METRNCQNCKKDFNIEPEDFKFYEKIKVPPPTFCSECRLQRRLTWRNERSLHKIKCKVPGHTEEIISMYGADDAYCVYDNDYWWSDNWDVMDYGVPYDFSIPFFLQFSNLLKRVPLASLSTINSVNSEYTNYVDANKNCYLIFGCGWNENIRYGSKLFLCKDSQDLFICTKCELSYECVGCIESYRLFWSINSKNCTDSYFLYNCRNCTNCFGCVNLVSKSYCIWNKQYTREEYLKKIGELQLGSYKTILDLKNKFNELYLSSVHRYANIFSSISCTGDYINNSKNSKNCFDLYQNVEDSKYLCSALDLKDAYDSYGVFKNELSYENIDGNVGHKNFSSLTLYNSENVNYAFNCHDLKNSFGCVGLRKKQYSILNKQYSKKDYEELLPKIIQHMNEMPYVDTKGRVYKYGEFFPSELSPFYYNETIAQEYFPLTKEEGQNLGFKWREQENREYKIDIFSDLIPDNIENTNDNVLNKVIECLHKGECGEQCTEAFKILPEELKFYKRMNISLPRLCSNCRHHQRFKQRNPVKLWPRTCMCEKSGHQNHLGKCEVEFETSYAPDRPEIVYCEKCYQAEVY